MPLKREFDFQFRIKAVKTGVPGVAYIRLDQTRDWPENLEVKLP